MFSVQKGRRAGGFGGSQGGSMPVQVILTVDENPAPRRIHIVLQLPLFGATGVRAVVHPQQLQVFHSLSSLVLRCRKYRSHHRQSHPSGVWEVLRFSGLIILNVLLQLSTSKSYSNHHSAYIRLPSVSGRLILNPKP